MSSQTAVRTALLRGYVTHFNLMRWPCLCVSLPMPTKMMRDAQRRARRKFSSVAPHFTARRCNVHFLTVANQVVVHRFAVYETFFPCLLSPTTNHFSLESIFNPSRQLLKFSLLVILCWNCYNILKFFSKNLFFFEQKIYSSRREG